LSNTLAWFLRNRSCPGVLDQAEHQDPMCCEPVALSGCPVHPAGCGKTGLFAACWVGVVYVVVSYGVAVVQVPLIRAA
ncbi:MAG: hypothetical protein K8T91_08785, partial [Planctomycetes bacterium]|nr:hypothetical protein [Planctomycetota bacterium]